jgi:plasmid stabilization system protein ParE
MTYRVIPTTAADRELEEAYQYIASENPTAAAKW